MSELERIFHSLRILWEFGPDRSSFAYFLIISYSQAVKAITTYLLINNTSCTAILWAARSSNSIFLANLEFYAGCWSAKTDRRTIRANRAKGKGDDFLYNFRW